MCPARAVLQKMIGGLYNSQGTKVRLTFKENNELWIGSATHTQQSKSGLLCVWIGS